MVRHGQVSRLKPGLSVFQVQLEPIRSVVPCCTSAAAWSAVQADAHAVTCIVVPRSVSWRCAEVRHAGHGPKPGCT